jgi:hypothetical protein
MVKLDSSNACNGTFSWSIAIANICFELSLIKYGDRYDILNILHNWVVN